MSLNITALQRNEQCYCGTSKKYKACCLRKDEEFYHKYRDQDVIIFHDMAITDGYITDEQYGDGRVSLTDEHDIDAVDEARKHFAGEGQHGDECVRCVDKLLAIIERNPQDPAPYNILYHVYGGLGRDEEAQAVLDDTVAKFPYYFFGKASKATNYFYNADFKGIKELFNYSYTLRQLYPHRELFHVSEARSFHFFTSVYSLPIMDLKRTRFQTRAFRRLNELYGYDKDPDSLIKEFDRFFDFFITAMVRSMRELDYEEAESQPEH